MVSNDLKSLLHDALNAFQSIVPLYFATAIGYAAFRYKVFTAEQSSGINKFIALLSIPLLSFKMIATHDPYSINLRFLAADALQKVVTLVALIAWAIIRHSADSKSWVISIFSITNFPNTIIVGSALLEGMYGSEPTSNIITQIVLFNTIWFNIVVLFMYEYNAAAVNGEATGISTTRILGTVFGMSVKNPNIYAGVLGLTWSLISFRWHIKIPQVVDNSISIISSTAIGLAMFSLGTTMAQQSRIISCKFSIAVFTITIKFLISPIITAICSLVVGLSGVILRIAIVQAALPLAVASFIYAKEYNIHPEIMSTGVILGMFIALPVTIIYYFILAVV